MTERRTDPSQYRFLIASESAHIVENVRHPLRALERSLGRVGMTPLSNRQSPAMILATKAISKMSFAANLFRSQHGPIFVACMGFAEFQCLPRSYWTEVVPYCFDCWPPGWNRWEGFFKRQRVRLAFFTARQSAEHFQQRIPSMRSVWLPEAVDPAEYDHGRRLFERGIDILELGRKNDEYHDKIRDALNANTHKFEQVKGQLIFPSFSDLRAGLANSKLSICFPSSLTHPARSGHVETVTSRYFESIASGCLLLGHTPRELCDLFGYNPGVEVEPGQEAAQIKYLLSNIDKYQELVNRNYSRMLQVATWDMRASQILQEITSTECAVR